MADPDRPKSFGNISEHHWSRSRSGQNEEALAYYRERSHAPGVESGGGRRNHYCMQCDGVIPWDQALAGDVVCPHCGTAVDANVKRFFNWVEMDQPPASDLRALLPLFAAAGVVVLVLGWACWWLLF